MTDTELRELISRNYSGVMRVCKSWLKSREDAEDAAQEVFARYIEVPRGFESPEHERAWFIRCAKSRAVDLYRKRSRESAHILPITDWSETPAPAEEPDGLDSLIASLPPFTQTVLRLHYGEGYGYKELAHILRTTEGRLKMLVSRAKLRLEKELTEERTVQNG